jgi:hypothetical protein
VNSRRTMTAVLVLSGLLLPPANMAYAQQPSQEQIGAVRQSCRSDFMANCSGVTPGGKDALACLKRNLDKLSASCRTAVSAITAPPAAVKPASGAPAPAASNSSPPSSEPAAPAAVQSGPVAPSTAEAPAKPAASAATQESQLKAVRQACTLNDFMSHCSWIQPSNPELLLCLQANATDLSPSCQAAVQGLPPPPAAASAPAPEPAEAKPTAKPNAKPVAGPAGSAPAKKPAAVERPAAVPALSTATAPAQPTEAQKSAIRAACRSDFMADCSGVQPGGAEALQCLQRNAAKLSSGCQSAVTAISGAAPKPAAASATSATPAIAPSPTVAPLGPIPPMRPREALAILALCRAEQQSLCSGIPIGGGRVLTCLADHAPQLSLECYQALAHASR